MRLSLPAPWWQSGVIPYRQGAQSLEVLLITSRRHARWGIPKGLVAPPLGLAGSACREAYEEAGVLGPVSARAIGSYQARKWQLRWSIRVYSMAVDTILEQWPEMHLRERRWFSVHRAARRVANAQLSALIAALPEMLERTVSG